MPEIRIRVGASLDASVAKTFQSIDKEALRLGKNLTSTFEGGGKSAAASAKTAQTSWERFMRSVDSEAERLLRGEERRGEESVEIERKTQRDRTRIVEQETGRRRDVLGRFMAEQRGAISFGRGAAIGVTRGAAMAVGAGRFLGHEAIGFGRALLQGVGVETSLAPHIANAAHQSALVRDVVNAGYIPGAAGSQGVLQDPEKVLAQVRATANATGQATNDVLGGLREFVALTGDLETGRKSLDGLAHLAKATGTHFNDMAKAAADVSLQLGDVPDKAAQVEAVMRVVAGQGKVGAIEMKDFARYLVKIAAQAPKFEGTKADNIGDLALLAQAAKMRGGAASAAEAATAVQAFATDLANKTTIKHWMNARNAQGQGLSPFTDAKRDTLRSPMELIGEALKWTHGDLGKMAELFPNQRGRKVLQAFGDVYKETSGTEEDKLRAVQEWAQGIRKATLDQAEIARAFGSAMDTTQSAVQVANNRLDEMASKLESAVLPALAGLAPAIEALTPTIVGLINKVAFLAGIDPDANKAHGEFGVRQNIVGALGKEIGTGTVDPGHIAAAKEKASEAAAAIVAEQVKMQEIRRAMAGGEDWIPGAGAFRAVSNFLGGITGITTGEQIAREQLASHEQAMRDNSKQLQDLRDVIARAMPLAGKPPVVLPPPQARPGGTMPADSEEP
jgi:hypothetical protein